MKYFIFIIIFLASFLNADIKFIASPVCKFKSIKKNEIKQLFMLKKSSINEENIKVIDNTDRKIYANFTKTYIGKSARKMKIYWTRMLFTGRKLPPKKFSTNRLKNLKDSSTCCVSYVDKKDIIEFWQTILVK